jgi:hypothetical protein
MDGRRARPNRSQPPLRSTAEPLPSPTFWYRLRETTMADDPSKRGPHDRSRINTSEDYEMRYWSRKLGVSPEQLKAAVRKVGSSVKAVDRELKASPVHSRWRNRRLFGWSDLRAGSQSLMHGVAPQCAIRSSAHC